MYLEYIHIRLYVESHSDIEIFDKYFTGINGENQFVNIQKLNNQRIITIGLLHVDYLEDLLQISRLYHLIVLRKLAAKGSNENLTRIFTCYLEVPCFENLTTRILLDTLNGMGYKNNISVNHTKSITHSLLTVTIIDELRACLYNVYQILLLQIGISNQHILRHEMVLQEIKFNNSKFLLDVGCGNGSFIFNCAKNLPEMSFIGVDFDRNKIQYAHHIKVEKFNQSTISFIVSNILEHLSIQEQIDCISLIEVIEHLNVDDLNRLFDNIFKLHPKTVVFTTPNYDYNIYLKTDDNNFRHKEHQFEFSEQEFVEFCDKLAIKYNYFKELTPIGFIKRNRSSISQMAVLNSRNI